MRFRGSPEKAWRRGSLACPRKRKFGLSVQQNDPSKKEGCNKAIARGERPKVRMMLIGHSLILFNAISESLIESLTYDADSGDVTAPALRFGDLIVLLNPAFEATRYTPLHRIATQRPYSRYQAPIFVSITSSADWATGRAFPLGRFFNTIFETTASPEESEANKNTMGHVPLYITHQLSLGKEEPCAGWKYLSAVPPADQPRQMRDNLAAEEANDRTFFGQRSQLADHWVRKFCGKAVLTHAQYDPNSPIWNVETDKDIIAGHNDIGGEALTNFLRQLYHDTLVYSLKAQ